MDPFGLADPKVRRRWIKDKGAMVFTFQHGSDPLRQVDVFLTPPAPFRGLWHRKTLVTIEEIPIPLICVRDLIILKGRAARPKDLEDVKRLSELP